MIDIPFSLKLDPLAYDSPSSIFQVRLLYDILHRSPVDPPLLILIFLFNPEHGVPRQPTLDASQLYDRA